MKLEDAQIDQIVWRCHTTPSSDHASLRKGIITIDGQGDVGIVKPLGVYIKGELCRLVMNDNVVDNWHPSPEEAVNELRQFYDKQAATGHNKLNELLASVGDKI
jgi:hypothetical protein